MKWSLLFSTAILFVLIMASPIESLTAQGMKDTGWKAGIARSIITPEQPLWMAGYASRTHPSVGKLTDLWAKALVLEDAHGKQAVLVTMDLVGIPKALSDHIRDELETRFHLSRSEIILNTSHTHTGPVLTDALVDIYPIDAAEQKKIDHYTDKLGDKIVALVGDALHKMMPAVLYAGNGVTRFQVNRRNNDEATLARQTALNGPNDYAVPVIKVTDNTGKVIAVAFGYACHNTTLNGYKWSGDYAGFAQMDLEKAYPGATALFFQGCGANQNPLPRRSVALAKQYGQDLAAAVGAVINGEMRKLQPELSTAYGEVDLALSPPPTKETLTKKVVELPGYEKRWAERLLKKLEHGDTLRTSYPYPVALWRLGDQPLVALGGEVVVEYAIELKEIFGQDLFVLGYSNDVMAYIPTPAILREGGYEGASSQMVYGLPAAWRADIKNNILHEVLLLAGQLGLPIAASAIN